jgi:septum formation protein
MELILASASPQRALVLRNAGFVFDVLPSHVDEVRFPNEGAEDYVRRVAGMKSRLAAEVRANRASQAMIIGADTVVVSQSQILGKPRSIEDARRMLGMLSGTTHEVLTGLSIILSPDGAGASHVETSRVSFIELSSGDIEDYLATGEPLDKAGAYGIQGIGGRFIWRIEGCYFNVMGLPVSRVWSLLRRFGFRDLLKS